MNPRLRGMNGKPERRVMGVQAELRRAATSHRANQEKRSPINRSPEPKIFRRE